MRAHDAADAMLYGMTASANTAGGSGVLTLGDIERMRAMVESPVLSGPRWGVFVSREQASFAVSNGLLPRELLDRGRVQVDDCLYSISGLLSGNTAYRANLDPLTRMALARQMGAPRPAKPRPKVLSQRDIHRLLREAVAEKKRREASRARIPPLPQRWRHLFNEGPCT